MKPMRKGALARLFEANPFGIALGIAAGRLWTGIWSALNAYSLNAPGLRLGPECKIIGGRNIRFGKGIFAHSDLWLEAVTSYRAQRFNPSISIGDHVSFSHGVHITAIESIAIGKHVLMGSRIYISDHNHGVYKGSPQSRPEEPPSERQLGGGGPVTIGDNVWIGDNVVIVGPVSIGNGAIIAANSVVRGVVQSNSMVAGSPARLIKIFNLQTGTWDRI
jgi:acetyltransferase-like isoleucine patch superfamily enzyme